MDIILTSVVELLLVYGAAWLPLGVVEHLLNRLSPLVL
jgi:hypothetical protein